MLTLGDLHIGQDAIIRVVGGEGELRHHLLDMGLTPGTEVTLRKTVPHGGRFAACLFLGKCGGIDKKNQIGDLILPIAAIRGEGTSNDYFPPEVPALPAFMLQRAVSSSIRDYGRDYWTGTVYTTNRRIWEHDEAFKEYLKKTRAMAVDMETATLFSCGFANHIPTGALLLVSDQPMTPDGVKTDKSDNLVTKNYVEEHVEIGIASLRMIIDAKKTVKHLKFDW